MKKLTICYALCNQPKVLGLHLRAWESYSDEAKARLSFILIDNDPAKNPIVLPPGLTIDVKVYAVDRVLHGKDPNDLKWNYGQTNLCFCVANTDWVFYGNIDHLIEPAEVEKILRLDLSSPSRFYLFQRYNPEQPPESRFNTLAHVGVYLIHKNAFWRAGGIEERLSGEYGFDDTLLLECLEHHGFARVVAPGIRLRNLSESREYYDADFRDPAKRTWDRTLSKRNRKILRRVRRDDYRVSRRYLNFAWRQVHPAEGSFTEIANRLRETEERLPAEFRRLTEAHGLGAYAHARALVLAPFGRESLASAARLIGASRTIRGLVEGGYLRLIVLTSEGERFPFGDVVPFGSLAGWPEEPVRRARFFKWAVPFLFPNIGTSVYVDSRFAVTDREEKIRRLFDETERHGFLVTLHDTRRGWEDEYREILRCGRAGDRRLLDLQRDFLAAAGVGSGVPVAQTGLLGRVHGSPLNRLSLPVLAQIACLSPRDQLALVYAQHRLGLSPHFVPEGKYLYTGISQRLDPESLCFALEDHGLSFRVRLLQHRVRSRLGADFPGPGVWNRLAGPGRVRALARLLTAPWAVEF